MERILQSFDLGEPDPPSCPECGRAFRRTLIRFDFEDVFFGFFPADVCEKRHTYLTQESSRAIDEMAKRRGTWGSGVVGTAAITAEGVGISHDRNVRLDRPRRREKRELSTISPKQHVSFSSSRGRQEFTIPQTDLATA